MNFNLFDSVKNEFVLFSGTLFDDEQSAFRHLNDLFFILFLLHHKKIDSKQITLAIDIKILNYLDKKTRNKTVCLIEHQYLTYSQIIRKIAGNIISVVDFEESFIRKDRNLIFFASGHGNIHGLSIGRNGHYLGPDYFEDKSKKDKTIFLYLSQCIAGAFHHLDTRKNICVLGACEYQTSLSIPIKKLKMSSDHEKIIKNFSFYDNVPINPFIFTFFINILLYKDLIKRDKKNILNLYKYVNSNTIEFVKNDKYRLYINTKTIKEDFMKIDIPYKSIQQPYLLNKILSTDIFFDEMI